LPETTDFLTAYKFRLMHIFAPEEFIELPIGFSLGHFASYLAPQL